jgi:hypothetical protein
MDFEFTEFDINEQVEAAITKVSDSGLNVSKACENYFTKTSFNRNIVTENGVIFANRELFRTKILRSVLVNARKQIEDLIMHLDAYRSRASLRREDGIERLRNSSREFSQEIKKILKPRPNEEEETAEETEA